MDRNGMKLWPYGVKLAITPLALVTCRDLKIKTITNMDYIAHVHSYIHNIDARGIVRTGKGPSIHEAWGEAELTSLVTCTCLVGIFISD